jgi:hypothetical protein
MEEGKRKERERHGKNLNEEKNWKCVWEREREK